MIEGKVVGSIRIHILLSHDSIKVWDAIRSLIPIGLSIGRSAVPDMVAL